MNDAERRARQREKFSRWESAHRARRTEYHQMLLARLREDPAWVEARRRWQRAYYLAHHEQLKRIQLARNRSRYARDREGVRAEQRRWRTEHVERTRLLTRLSNHRRRLRAGTAVIKADDWLQLLERHGGRCGYCRTDGPLEMEHRVPIARGGTHELSNLIPACRRCNQRKATKTEEEFRRSLAADGLKDAEAPVTGGLRQIDAQP